MKFYDHKDTHISRLYFPCACLEENINKKIYLSAILLNEGDAGKNNIGIGWDKTNLSYVGDNIFYLAPIFK